MSQDRVVGSTNPGGGVELPPGVELTTLDNGVRIVTEAMPSVRSVSLGIWVRTGSRDESAGQEGVSHFLEHLLFKGTPNYSATDISEVFDGLGAAVNASTSKEVTNLYARFLDEHTDRAVAVLAEMFLQPTFPEIDSERQVVLEEIAMYEDEPSDRVHDVLSAAMFGSHPLGKRVLGAAEVIAAIPVPEIAAYHQDRYRGSNLVVAAAGSLDHDKIVELTEKCLLASAEPLASRPNGAAATTSASLCFYPKDTEQYHLCIGAPGLARDDDRRYVLSVLDSIFGGSTSSRLFREVREKRGLAYAVGSYNEGYADCGISAVYVGTRADNVTEACRVIGEEMALIRDEGVTAAELERAKESVKGRMVLGLESTSARMVRVARPILLDLELPPIDETLARIDAVSLSDVAALSAELFAPERLSAACIGPDESHFRAALGPVSETLG